VGHFRHVVDAAGAGATAGLGKLVRAKTGLLLNGIVIVVAVIRLHLGGGVI
jgi:hypothetical protein